MHRPRNTPRKAQQFQATRSDVVMAIADQACQAIELSAQGGAGVLGRIVGTSDMGNSIFSACVVGSPEMVEEIGKAFGAISQEICEKHMGPPDLVKTL